MTVFTDTLTANRYERVLTENKDRKEYWLKNDSATDIFVGHDAAVGTTGRRAGFLLASGGGFVADDKYKGDVFVITTANVSITVVEIVWLPWEKRPEVGE